MKRIIVFLFTMAVFAGTASFGFVDNAQAAESSLRIESKPSGAQIFINSAPVGNTPMTLDDLPPGSMIVQVKQGDRSNKRIVSIGEGQSLQINFDLPSGNVVIVDQNQPGTLFVNASPTDSTVRVLNVSQKYKRGMPLKAGTYKVEISKPGYTTKVLTVNVSAGKPSHEAIVLKYKGGTQEPPKPKPAAVQQKGTWRDPKTGMEFVWIPGGCYQMGQTAAERRWLINDGGQKKYDKFYSDELRHKVCVDGFWMGRYEVTRGEFRKFVNATGYRTDAERKGDVNIKGPSTNWRWEKRSGYNWSNAGVPQTDRHPASIISWNDAQAFLRWLQRSSIGTFRLPTEAEWEYAARAGTTSKWYWGDDKTQACKYASVSDRGSGWPADRSFPCSDHYKGTAPVGMFRPNAWGLYDMMGNVWEWCEDIFTATAYSRHSRNNPVNGTGGTSRVRRGGSWLSWQRGCRSAERSWNAPDHRRNSIGFRVVKKN